MTHFLDFSFNVYLEHSIASGSVVILVPSLGANEKKNPILINTNSP